jgi:hypothetical protein
VDKVQMTAGKTKKQFTNPLRIIDAPVISLCLAKYNRASCLKAKGAVKLHLNPDGDSLMPYDACLSTGKVHDIHGMAGLCDESGVIYVPGRGYVDYKSLYNSCYAKASLFPILKADSNSIAFFTMPGKSVILPQSDYNRG